MNDHEAYELVMKHLCKEICRIAEDMQKNQRMTSQNLDDLDKMFHLKKGMLTCKAMEDEYEEEDGFSGRRGRSRTTGRYMSRDTEAQSYADGYSQGYNEAVSQMNNGGNSGHVPMMPYPPRRW